MSQLPAPTEANAANAANAASATTHVAATLPKTHNSKHSDNDNTNTATSGLWTRVDPIGTTAQPEDDHTDAPGHICFVTGNGSVGGAAGEAEAFQKICLYLFFNLPPNLHRRLPPKSKNLQFQDDNNNNNNIIVITNV
jgi:hypothetical protein